MAMTKKQVEGVTSLFVLTFMVCEKKEDRKKAFLQFEDAFARSISDWKEICRKKIREKTNDETVLTYFDELCERKEMEPVTIDTIQIRKFMKEDYLQVRELLNQAFDLSMIEEDEHRLDAFLNGDCSFVACQDEEVVGVALASRMPDVSTTVIYLDCFTVAENMRGKGIGKRLLNAIKSLDCGGYYGQIRLKTDKKLDAYEIYKHWGFAEDTSTHMKLYFFSKNSMR